MKDEVLFHEKATKGVCMLRNAAVAARYKEDVDAANYAWQMRIMERKVWRWYN